MKINPQNVPLNFNKWKVIDKSSLTSKDSYQIKFYLCGYADSFPISFYKPIRCSYKRTL
jgi:hypothetical protein